MEGNMTVTLESETGFNVFISVPYLANGLLISADTRIL